MAANAQYDLVVLGGGTGGYVAAIRAAQLGMKVAVVEKDKVGGTCLHLGCIPTKALLHTAELLHQVRHGDQVGLAVESVALDYPKALSYKERVVGQLYRGVQYLLKKNGVTTISGRGTVLDAHRIRVETDGGPEEVLGQHLLIATGSVPRPLPGVPFDGQRVVSSDHVLTAQDLPGSILIIGGGAIGVEFASMYHDFGVEVTVVEMMDHLLPSEDVDIAHTLETILTKRGIHVLTGAELLRDRLKVDASGVTAAIATRQGDVTTVRADRMLVAIGRAPLTEGIGLEAVGVATDRGFIRVDDRYRTSVPGIWAIGDVIGGYLLAHVAAHEGMIAVETMAGQDPEGLSPLRVPRVTYCRPEVASVGWTAAEAEAQGHRVKVGTFPFRANGRSLILGEAEGMVKLVADQETDALLGAHIIGPNASDLVNEMALARFLESTGWEVAESVHAHPTVSEVLHEAALALDGHAIHV
ncbi:MAG: dihydrolipoyl dehydrogenase [Firmicutes bacterium]|nr:dihydrolipoyl dehydrogenase [Alicyclobacillaceae bacterium]MCL6496166.1 dihydrolipoyl dehydrogenase [Bacillota bacterium]